ncbi:hypothetical protein PIIN_01024 [Serendipita indica DSM 11827]|uniref:Protein transport protein SFT2 n=1 Tax=Serendipita indica (strain DSM 11827) TaxID=1109443 RepID=G4T782_SERID|nr:hypothetical protein PIIN_01024 [Serendipita indica DSM 11827]
MPSGWYNLEAATAAVPTFEEEPAFSFLKLSRTQRIYGFGACMAIGFVLSIIGTSLLYLGLTIQFALMFTLGTIVSLIGTGFIVGFTKQLTAMFKPIRVVASIVFLGAIGMTFVAAFILHNKLLCLILVIVQYLAFLW